MGRPPPDLPPGGRDPPSSLSPRRGHLHCSPPTATGEGPAIFHVCAGVEIPYPCPRNRGNLCPCPCTRGNLCPCPCTRGKVRKGVPPTMKRPPSLLLGRGASCSMLGRVATLRRHPAVCGSEDDVALLCFDHGVFIAGPQHRPPGGRVEGVGHLPRNALEVVVCVHRFVAGQGR